MHALHFGCNVRACALLQQAKAEGIPLLTGGGRPSHLEKGYFVQPTVFTEVEAKHTLWTEEVFGPVMGVTAFDTEEQAIVMANDTNFGLAAAVISKDEEVSSCSTSSSYSRHTWSKISHRQPYAA